MSPYDAETCAAMNGKRSLSLTRFRFLFALHGPRYLFVFFSDLSRPSRLTFGRPWGSLDLSWPLRGRSWAPCGRPEADLHETSCFSSFELLGPLGALLGAPGAPGAPGARLGSSWGSPGQPFCSPVAIYNHLALTDYQKAVKISLKV